MSQATTAPPSPIDSASARFSFAEYALVAIIVTAPLLFAVSHGPWESDQPPKAAQILEIAQRHDYLLSDELPDCYRLRLFPLYYAASGLLYAAIGGDIYRFMNLTSVAMGLVAGLSLADALRRAFGIRPLWTAITLVAMPLFVITFSYGNEVAWSLALFCLSLALVATPSRWTHIAGGAAVAASLSCRIDILFLAPFWLAWVAMFCRLPQPEPWFKRLLRPALAFLVTELMLWALLVRGVPATQTSFEWGFNLMLIMAYLTYPFNLSVVLLSPIGWLLLWKRNRSYALAHFLLLLPLGFYAGMLASPKYVISLLLFYGLPTAFLINEVRPRWKAALLALLGAWAVIGVSNYGLFGPRRASLWYVPTADGPIPIGGYVEFYRHARRGDYQDKHLRTTELMERLIEPAKAFEGPYRIVGFWHENSVSLLRAQGKLGTPEEAAKYQAICTASKELDVAALQGDARILINLSGYTDLDRMNEQLAEQVRQWMSSGQLRSLEPAAREPLPAWIEVGDHIPQGQNTTLGERLLFINEYYQEQMIFETPYFVADYRSTSWVPTGRAAELAPAAEPIYQDDEFAAFDQPVEGATVYGYVWPAKYYRMKSPRQRHRDAPATE